MTASCLFICPNAILLLSGFLEVHSGKAVFNLCVSKLFRCCWTTLLLRDLRRVLLKCAANFTRHTFDYLNKHMQYRAVSTVEISCGSNFKHFKLLLPSLEACPIFLSWFFARKEETVGQMSLLLPVWVLVTASPHQFLFCNAPLFLFLFLFQSRQQEEKVGATPLRPTHCLRQPSHSTSPQFSPSGVWAIHRHIVNSEALL